MTGAFGLWALAAGGSEAWTLFVCAVMLHGIYSLSFLELWALADDSYSLAMMDAIDKSRVIPGRTPLHAIEAIGMRKRTMRMDTLKGLGLVREAGDGSIALTFAGRVAALLARGLLFLVNTRKYG
jgi:hypothetical protein